MHFGELIAHVADDVQRAEQLLRCVLLERARLRLPRILRRLCRGGRRLLGAVVAYRAVKMLEERAEAITLLANDAKEKLEDRVAQR